MFTKVPCELPNCKKLFYNRCSMHRHMKTLHLNTSQYDSIEHNCDQCGKSFPTKGQLRNHYTTHTGKLHKCRHCPGFEFTPYLRPDSETQKVYPCTEENCLKFYYHEHNLINHFHTRHTPTYGFECDLCGKRFWEKRYVKIHLNQHVREMEIQNQQTRINNRSDSLYSVNNSIPNVETSMPEELVCTPHVIKLEPIPENIIQDVVYTPNAIKLEPLDEEQSDNETKPDYNALVETAKPDTLVCSSHFVKQEPSFDLEISDKETTLAVLDPSKLDTSNDDFSIDVKPLDLKNLLL